MEPKAVIAKRVAQELRDGDVINLGIGIPTLVAEFLPENLQVTLHSENGLLGLGAGTDAQDPNTTNAAAQPVSIIPGGATFDSVLSFTIVRGGHIDVTVLGALEVDQQGNLANWTVPGKLVPGMGGAMDLVVGAKRVLVAMEHTAKDGSPKILKKCRLPLTAVGVVTMIITNLAAFEVTPAGLVLKELAPGISLENVTRETEAAFTVAADLKVMPV